MKADEFFKNVSGFWSLMLQESPALTFEASWRSSGRSRLKSGPRDLCEYLAKKQQSFATKSQSTSVKQQRAARREAHMPQHAQWHALSVEQTSRVVLFNPLCSPRTKVRAEQAIICSSGAGSRAVAKACS